MLRILALVSFLVPAVMIGPATGHAQDLRLTGYGLRTGASLDDDLTQFLIGGHIDLGRLARDVRFQPFLTAGFGDDALSLLLAGEVHYLFPVNPSTSTIEPYVGAGVGLNHVDFDDPGDDDTEAALLVVGGIESPIQRGLRLFGEARFVIADQTVFRLETGLTWAY